ncbi:uncharacterized protein LOC122575338 isoform X2 [Bombus pyrosoma]|uniref:uncharacterized protein LOC122575338 isoform X2 n=1 Tax=Bombus pyrosoma TaxID=396416 RepID=UPI001CB9767C|nr:uncharacterized protein LOC122575338 isoform X2 [Bombus pyrosoma]
MMSRWRQNSVIGVGDKMQLRRIRQLDTESTRWRQSYGRSGSVRWEFRLLPIMFLMGGLLEFVMIHWHVGEVNFYRTYKKRRIEEAVERRLAEMNAQVNR